YWGLCASRVIWEALVPIVFSAHSCYGYHQAVTDNVLVMQSFVGAFPLTDTVNTTGATEEHNSTIQGVSVALFNLGSSVGALLCMKFGDLLGRRMTIFVSAIITIMGTILMASWFQLAQLIVARLILGVGSGGYTATIPMSGVQHRGSFINAEGIFIGVEIVIALLIELGLFFVNGYSVSWRFPFALQIVFLVVVVALVFTLPESSS
ncbi:general substrate transporter, partial [Paraphaeosphaeria sporulosa]